MRELIPCLACQRHVQSDETACPFCGAAVAAVVSAKVCRGPCSGHVAPRLGRAALLAVGATLLCAACESSVIPVYGVAIIVDGGADAADAGAQADAKASLNSAEARSK